MFTPTILAAIVVVIVWAISSGIVWGGLKLLKEGNFIEQMQYGRTSQAERFIKILFAPVLLLSLLIKYALDNWHVTAALGLVLVLGFALTGCQTNVVTAPNSTFMVDSSMVCKPAQ